MTTETDAKVYTFRYLTAADREDFASRALVADALAPERSLLSKWRAIVKLGIHVEIGDDPGDAWLRAMCQENGEEFTRPVSAELAGALVSSGAPYRFYWWLV